MPGRAAAVPLATSGLESPDLSTRLGKHRVRPTSPLTMIWKEISAFGAFGLLGLMVDIGLFNLLFDYGQVVAKCVSTTTAMAVTFLGNRYVSFSHRAGSRAPIRGQLVVFVTVNLVVLLLSVAVLLLFEYPLLFKDDKLVMNGVNLATIAAGTVLRFWAYKRFVFTAETTQKVGDRRAAVQHMR